MHGEKTWFQLPIADSAFFDHLLSFFTCKAAVNALRLYMKIAQRLSYQHWPWCKGGNKTPPFLHFPKAEQGPLRSCQFMWG
jgi:hypothetical protein